MRAKPNDLASESAALQKLESRVWPPVAQYDAHPVCGRVFLINWASSNEDASIPVFVFHGIFFVIIDHGSVYYSGTVCDTLAQHRFSTDLDGVWVGGEKRVACCMLCPRYGTWLTWRGQNYCGSLV